MKRIENFSFNSKVKWKCDHRQCHMNKKKHSQQNSSHFISTSDALQKIPGKDVV